MDLDYSLNEQMIIIPRNYNVSFKKEKNITNHYAIFGIGVINNDYPLFADAANEKGLAIAILNFKDNSYYNNEINKKINLAPYELALYLLCKCSCIDEVKEILSQTNICDIDFSNEVTNTPIHYMVSDKQKSIVIEPTINGLKVYDNPYNVLTNNPEFAYHKENIKNYINLSIEDPKDNFNLINKLIPYSYNQGLIGLPGDYSSSSRFIKTLFIKNNMCFSSEDPIIDFFLCLDSVKMLKGLVKTPLGYEYTIYNCCIDLNTLIYYYKNYNNNIKTFKLSKYDLNSNKILNYKL